MNEMNSSVDNGNLNNKINWNGHGRAERHNSVGKAEEANFVAEEHESSWRSFCLSDVLNNNSLLRSAFAFATNEAERAFAWGDCWDDDDDD